MPTRRLYRGRLPSCSLGEVERAVFKIIRDQDDVPGYLIPQMYGDYLRSGNPAEMRRVIYHNTIDILSMVTLAAHLMEVFATPFGSSIPRAARRAKPATQRAPEDPAAAGLLARRQQPPGRGRGGLQGGVGRPAGPGRPPPGAHPAGRAAQTPGPAARGGAGLGTTGLVHPGRSASLRRAGQILRVAGARPGAGSGLDRAGAERGGWRAGRLAARGGAQAELRRRARAAQGQTASRGRSSRERKE